MRSRAARTTGTIALRCSRDASSGTTPPYFACIVICEATTLERMTLPFSTTAAAVSSHEDSMPRISLEECVLMNLIIICPKN